jgi:hypothetical protein
VCGCGWRASASASASASRGVRQAVAPDGSSVCYCARPAGCEDEAWSTNTHIYLHVLRGATNPLDTVSPTVRD